MHFFFAIFHRVFRRRSREGRSYCNILTEVADPPLVRLGCRSIGTQTRSSATLCSSVLCFPLAFVRWATIPSPPQRISFNRHYVWREYLLPRSGVGGMTYGTWYSHAVVGQEVPRNRGDMHPASLSPHIMSTKGAPYTRQRSQCGERNSTSPASSHLIWKSIRTLSRPCQTITQNAVDP